VQITVSDVASLYRPSKCERRVYLQTQDIAQSEATAYDECLRKMGINHEQQHLATLGEYVDLSKLSREKRIEATAKAISEGAAVIYQGGFFGRAVWRDHRRIPRFPHSGRWWLHHS